MDATTGDWTLDSSRTRLHEYFLHRGIEVEYDMLEIGFPPDRALIQHLVVQQKDFHQAEVHLPQSLQKSKKIIHKGNNKLLTIIPGSNLAT